MTIISSQRTWFYKKVLPALLVVFALAASAIMLSVQSQPHAPPFPVIFMPLIGLGIAFFVVRHLTSGLADEVDDQGAYLLVRRNGQEEQVLLTNIMNVSYSLMVNPPRITLRLRQPGRFGDDIAFIPPCSGLFENFRLRNALADDLIQRVDAARGK